MINAELNHNPYLLLTTVKFNGHEPRINSQIEKYEHQPLKDWVHKVPDIFYNEMNGYDFDLNFVGTVPDYEEVQKAFSLAGISQEEVRIFHKNELEDANTKSNEIDQIIEWLREHPNRKFDFASFWEKNSELFESTYPYIIIRGEVPKETMPDVGIEVVEKAQELSNTVLSSTPILFYIDGKSAKQFRQDFQYILSRHDIRNEQLFL